MARRGEARLAGRAWGVPLRVVQEVLRHTNIRTTADRYTHLVPQVVSEALAAMDPVLGG